jgi:hypothetical protein
MDTGGKKKEGKTKRDMEENCGERGNIWDSGHG